MKGKLSCLVHLKNQYKSINFLKQSSHWTYPSERSLNDYYSGGILMFDKKYLLLLGLSFYTTLITVKWCIS